MVGNIGVLELALYAAGGVIVSMIIGGLIGAKLADMRLRKLYAEVRHEVAHVRNVASEKLAVDEPDLEKLLQDLNRGVEQTFRAAAALDDHEKMMIRKTEAGKEITASSRHIIKMIDELGGDVEIRALNEADADGDLETVKRLPELD